MQKRLNPRQVALVAHWEAETRHLSAAFRTMEAKFMAGHGARPGKVWDRFVESHREAGAALQAAREALADARRGRPVTGPSGVIEVLS